MTDRKRRGGLDRFLEPPPRYPSLSPDIEIGHDGYAIVDTSNGVDEVYFLSSHPISYNGPLEGADSNDEQIDNYDDDGSIEAETEADSVEDDDDTDEDTPSSDSVQVEQPENIFDAQARIWRTVLKRREHAAIVQTTEALTQSLTISEAWQTNLLVNAAIRKIIYSLEAASLFILRDSRHAAPFRPSIVCAHPRCPLPSRSITTAGTAYLSLESVSPSALARSDGGGLRTTPGIQVTDDVFIPVFIRPARKTSSFVTSSSSSSSYRPDYRAPRTAFGKHPLTAAGGHCEPEDDEDDVTVHSSLCIPCLRDLYVGAAIPDIATVFPDVANSSSADDCQQSTSGAAGNPGPEQDQNKMPGFAEPGFEWPAMASSSNSNGGGSGWNALNLKKTEDGGEGGGTGQQQQRYPASGIPQLDGIGETQNGSGGGSSSGSISSGGLGCAVM